MNQLSNSCQMFAGVDNAVRDITRMGQAFNYEIVEAQSSGESRSLRALCTFLYRIKSTLGVCGSMPKW